MDDLDNKILKLLAENARITVKEIAENISLTSPAVSERIKRMEKNGTIAGYTVVLGEEQVATRINALINISVKPEDRNSFLQLIEKEHSVRRCHHVTGSYSHILKVSCADMFQLEKLISGFQTLGQTNTQIVLSTPVDRYAQIIEEEL